MIIAIKFRSRFPSYLSSFLFDRLSQCGLHIDLLPYVIGSGQIAGAVQHEWCGIRAGTTVMAALGDVQCAVYSVIKSPQDAGKMQYDFKILCQN